MKRIGKRTIIFENKPRIISYGSVVGKKEHEGPLSNEFDAYTTDSFFGEKSFEKAESKLQKTAVQTALDKAGLTPDDIDNIFAGDLLNQCIGSSFGLRSFGIPFIGLYGACSTMALSAGLAAVFIDSGAAKKNNLGHLLALLLGRAAIPLSAQLRISADPDRSMDGDRLGRSYFR